MKYQVGGSLSSQDPCYVERQADTELYSALKQGEFCYVLNSRQMGKSSLLVRTWHRLKVEGAKCAAVDMTKIGSQNITPLQWYKSFITVLWSGFEILDKSRFLTWWKEQEDVSLQLKLSLFIEELLLVHFPQERLFIFVDEIDSILTLYFSVDDFFALIRYCHNQRAINPEYQRITFAIFGVATPSDLIKSKNLTPFNIGKAIEIHGFKQEEVLPLARGLEVTNKNPHLILQEILAWTQGQPFLTQKLCKLVAISEQNDIISEASLVESILRSCIIESWKSQDEPEHLRTIRDRIEYSGNSRGKILSIYQQILKGISVETDDSSEQIKLLLSGLVVRDRGILKVKNRIYSEVFNLEWLAKELASLRPYSESLSAWVDSGKTDDSRLLHGQALKDALAWALDKSLSDLDYQYLAASQELVKQETEKALLSLKQANHILSTARRRAKQESNRHRIKTAWTGITALSAAIFIILLRFGGLLQGLEWNTLDQFFRTRTLESPDPRIAIVTVDENDLTEIGQWPIPDDFLTQAIENIKGRNPKAIGLDLYRNLPVEPGYQKLVKIYKSTPNLIGTEKVISGRIAPPQILSQLEQVGFADLVLDADGKIRRGLISLSQGNQVYRSFGLRLSLAYLKAQGITPKPIDSNRTKLGRGIFVRFNGDNGGYVRADDGGYQILLNFRGLLKNFQTISFTDVLKNRIPTNCMENRIILIGMIAESLNDLYYTPYSSSLLDAPKRTPGVAIHANLISHILSAALDGRPTLQAWAKSQEWFWILGWSWMGAILTWRFKSGWAVISSIIFAGTGLLFIAYLFFLQGWWIPVVPTFLGLAIAAIGVSIISYKKLEQVQLRLILNYLQQESTTDPTVKRIAIEYLKQSESDRNQAIINKIVETEHVQSLPRSSF